MQLSNKGKKITLISGIIIAIMAILVVVYLTIIAPSFVGRTGTDGNLLKTYIEPQALKQLTEKPNKEIWIIDVRSEKLYQKGHIPTARSYPSNEIENRLSELPKDKYLIIYCETGGRVQVVMNKLEKHGYSRYMNWGGYTRWPYELESGV